MERAKNAHAMQIVKAISSYRWPKCGLWRQSTARRREIEEKGKEPMGRKRCGRKVGAARVPFRSSSLPVYSNPSDVILYRKMLIKWVSPFYRVKFRLTYAISVTHYFPTRAIGIVFKLKIYLNNFEEKECVCVCVCNCVNVIYNKKIILETVFSALNYTYIYY